MEKIVHKNILFIATCAIATLNGMEQTAQPRWLSVTTSDGHQIPLSQELVEKVPVFRAAFENCIKDQKEKSLALPEISHKALMSLLPLIHEEIVTPINTQAMHLAILEARHNLKPALNIGEAVQGLIAADYLGLTGMVESYSKFLGYQAHFTHVSKELVMNLQDYGPLLSNIAKYCFLKSKACLRKIDTEELIDFNVSLQDLQDSGNRMYVYSIGKCCSLINNHLNSLKNNFIIPEMYRSIKRFDLSHNNFTEFPQELALFTNLRSLSLRKNKINAIPEDIAPLANLTELELGGNPIEYLPQSFTQLTNLKKLTIKKSLAVVAQLNNWSHVKSIGFRDNNTLYVDFREKEKPEEKEFKRPDPIDSDSEISSDTDSSTETSTSSESETGTSTSSSGEERQY